MGLVLRVKGSSENAPPVVEPVTLEHGAITVGRGAECDLVLPDPQRTISKQQCIIEAGGGRYRLTDTSTNGVFLNDGDRPIGRGNSVDLNHGDELRIRDFRIGVDVISVVQPAPAPVKPATVLDDTHDFPGRRDDLDAMIGLSGDLPSPVLPADSHGLGPGPIPEDFDLWGEDSQPAPARHEAIQTEHIPPQQEHFAAPQAIPGDWDAEPGAAPVPIPADPDPVPPVASVPSPSEAAPPPARTAPASAAPAGASDRAALQAFLDGAQLDLEIPDDQVLEVMRVAGAIYQEVVKGLMEVLAARSSIKNEFRLSQTTIQPVENNPLKFSLGADDAMTALLTRRGRGYLPPVAAVQEAIDDVKAHQVAVLAGMQVALTGLLHRFNPDALEDRMQKERSLASLLSTKKARYWDAFGQLYKDLIVEAEDDFHKLFGREFARAYEEQVRKLGNQH